MGLSSLGLRPGAPRPRRPPTSGRPGPGVWSAGFQRRRRHRRENYHVCTARPMQRSDTRPHGKGLASQGGLREGQEGELGPREGPSEPGWVSPGDFGFVGPFPGQRETVLILVYIRVSGEAASLRIDPAISSQFCNLSRPGAMETILTGSRAASPTHRERGPPCANLGFNLSAQHSHRLGSLRRGLPPPARPADTLCTSSRCSHGDTAIR